jgi:hypothetical protein
MRILALSLLAAAGIALAVPAQAEDAYVGVGPVGVDVGVHRDHGDRAYAEERDHRRHCEVTIVRRHGVERKIRHCG